MPISQSDLLITIQKMIFIYNALLSGWTIVMVDKDKFEFKKGNNNSKEVDLDDYLERFIKYNLDMDNIINI
jgi:hypothetical protein